MLFDKEKVKYCIYQREITPTNNVLHWQMYCVLYNPITLKGLKKVFNSNTMHAEPSVGTHEQNVEYCTKSPTSIPNTQVIFGKHDEQGRRTDIEQMKEDIEKGMNLDDVAITHPGLWMRYDRGIKSLANAIRGARTVKKNTLYDWIYIYGPNYLQPILERPDIAHIYIKEENKWWDGYDGQKTCVLDITGKFPDQIFKIMNQMRFETKGGYVHNQIETWILIRPPGEEHPHWPKAYGSTNFNPEGTVLTHVINNPAEGASPPPPAEGDAPPAPTLGN